MIPLVIAACWVLVVSLVAALCLAAKRGDRDQRNGAAGPLASELAYLQRWQAGERLTVYGPTDGAQTVGSRRAKGRSLAGVGGARG